MDEATGDTRHPFERWVDAARPKTQIWRLVVGCMIIFSVWMVWTIAVLLPAAWFKLINRESIMALFTGEAAPTMTQADATIILVITIATIAGLGLGVWLVVRWLHGRSLMSVVAYDRRFSFAQFGVGCAIACGYLALSVGFSVLTGAGPKRSELEIGPWLVSLAPLALALLAQTASEELMFRGYLPQQLAARFRHPLVWGFAPTLLFGLIHAGNVQNGDLQFMAYYVFSATVLGLTMLAMVWRTGRLSAVIGMHFVNNLVAFTVAGPDQGKATTALFVWSPQDQLRGSAIDILLVGLTLAFVLSPLAPLPRGRRLRRGGES